MHFCQPELHLQLIVILSERRVLAMGRVSLVALYRILRLASLVIFANQKKGQTMSPLWLSHTSGPFDAIKVVIPAWLLLSAVFFYDIMIQMRIQFPLTVLLLLALTHSQTPATPVAIQPIKKGLTMQATLWPSYESNWAGRVSCNNCNPFEGDTPCNRSLPLFCISSPKSIVRPFYRIATQFTPFSVLDGGYYDGWTGGFIQATLPVMGSAITSYKVGDALCKGYFGNNSNFATFDSGYYMPFMNKAPMKAWSLWDWGQTQRGQWNFWGYFAHRFRGRAWVWVNGQPNGNCGN